MLSVALATDQRSSNGSDNCNRQADPYQPAVKMVTNICSVQIPYSGVVSLLKHYTPLVFFANLSIHPADFFPHIDSKKVLPLFEHSVTKSSVISSVQYTLSFIASFFEEMFSQSRIFYENNMILCRPKVV